jgi:hypothetical protein
MRRFWLLSAICALLPTAALAATATPVSGTFKGATSQGKTVKIKVASGRLKGSSVGWSASCTTHGFSLSGTTSLTGELTGKRYKHREVYTVAVKHGYKAKHIANAQFKVSRAGHRLTGSFNVTAVVYAKPGVITTTCTSSKVTFTAHT